MIYKASKDPVFIKKISLKVWKLKDEIKSEIKNKLANSEEEEQILSDLSQNFKSSSPELKLISGGDDSPEQSTEASQEAKANETQTSETSEEELVKVVQTVPNLEEGEIHLGKTFLAEVDMNQIRFFCNETFLEGQAIVVQFLVPRPFILNIEILNSRLYSLNSRIISELKMPYRVIGKFTFERIGERALLRDFLSSVEPELEQGPAPKVEEETQEDIGDDLDLSALADLDL